MSDILEKFGILQNIVMHNLVRLENQIIQNVHPLDGSKIKELRGCKKGMLSK